MVYPETACESVNVAVREITQIRLGGLPVNELIPVNAVVVENGEPRDQEQREPQQRRPMRRERSHSGGWQIFLGGDMS